MLQNNKAIAYALMRFAIGINIFGHGFFRILSGVGVFANTMVQGLDKGPLPHAATLTFLYATPYIELALGLMLILGLFTRVTLVLNQLFMVALTFGSTSIQNWAAASTQLEYSVIFFILLWLVQANSISIDGLMRRENYRSGNV